MLRIRRTACWLLAALTLCQTGFAEPRKPGSSTAKRPNILLIMADDLGYECLRSNGGTSYSTPNLDRLAATGVRFTHCFVNPICTPTRVALMTGRYNSRNYIRFGALPAKEPTFGHTMQDAGYATCIVEKWQLSGEGGTRPDQAGFESTS